MLKKPKIHIVDDSPEEIFILIEDLKDDYIVNATTSAEEAFSKLDKADLPDVILMDINMPDIDGYKACRRLKDDNDFKSIDVIFLSSNDSTEEIMRGFDVGAMDYVTKPYDPKVLKSKLSGVFKLRQEKNALRQQAESASSLVNTVMSETGKLASIIDFLRSSFTVKDAQSLMDIMLGTFQQNSLSAVVYFDAHPIKLSQSTNSLPTMLEIELMERMVGGDKSFIEANSRTFIIQENVVALIRNMPEESTERTSIKDNLKILLEGANTKLKNLAEMKNLAGENINKTFQAISNAKSTLDEVHVMQEAHKKHSMEILDEMVREVEASFFSMGLTDEQEQNITNILHKSVERSLDHFENGLEMDKKIRDVVTVLSRTATDSAKSGGAN